MWIEQGDFVAVRGRPWLVDTGSKDRPRTKGGRGLKGVNPLR
jgi:hypothetical protein